LEKNAFFCIFLHFLFYKQHGLVYNKSVTNMIQYKFTTTRPALEEVKISDCKVGQVLSLEQGLYRICLFVFKGKNHNGKDQYILGKEWIDKDGICRSSGVCFCDGDELAMRVSDECYKATLAA
jgi:hypothetical protein